MAVTTRNVSFTITEMTDVGEVKISIGDDGQLILEQGDDSVWLDHAGARALVDAISELFPA